MCVLLSLICNTVINLYYFNTYFSGGRLSPPASEASNNTQQVKNDALQFLISLLFCPSTDKSPQYLASLFVLQLIYFASSFFPCIHKKCVFLNFIYETLFHAYV